METEPEIKSISCIKKCFTEIKFKLVVPVFFIVSFCSTSPSEQTSKTKNNASPFPYNLDIPDEKFSLPSYLKEISGIAYYKDSSILCVQDEKAIIYELNLINNEIINKYNFGKDGDYEDITIVGKTVYVLRSDGHLFEVINFDQGNIAISEHDTPLSKSNDTEGLTYDRSSQSLLIVCKASPALKNGKQFKGFKALYQFDIDKKKLNKEPVFLVDLDRFEQFRPSGLAVHPISDEIYLLSSSGKVLAIMGRDGEILNIQSLNSGLFSQPEGICFSPTGDLFISNEGKGVKGNVLRFVYNKNK